MAGRGNPVLLRTTGWGRKTFGAVTTIQLCRRERNTFTCKPTSGITGSVNEVKLQDTASTYVQKKKTKKNRPATVIFPTDILKKKKSKNCFPKFSADMHHDKDFLLS